MTTINQWTVIKPSKSKPTVSFLVRLLDLVILSVGKLKLKITVKTLTPPSLAEKTNPHLNHIESHPHPPHQNKKGVSHPSVSEDFSRHENIKISCWSCESEEVWVNAEDRNQSLMCGECERKEIVKWKNFIPFVMVMFLSGICLGVEFPKKEFTPGETDPILTKEVICGKGFRTGDYRQVSLAKKRRVFEEYGIDWGMRSHYEVDHLIAIVDGGSNALMNLWPQPIEEARLKDVLEVWVHRKVCNDEMDLEGAQEKLADDWYTFYNEMKRNEVTIPMKAEEVQ